LRKAVEQHRALKLALREAGFPIVPLLRHLIGSYISPRLPELPFWQACCLSSAAAWSANPGSRSTFAVTRAHRNSHRLHPRRANRGSARQRIVPANGSCSRQPGSAGPR
jgi:hypothetical protein